MHALKDIKLSSEALSAGLQENGMQHINYKMYTSMERALALVCTGNFYISNGSNWNDIDDSQVMTERRLFAKCFSCSTMENIAMWMLYSGHCGEDGAMVNFPRAVINDMLESKIVELGSFGSSGNFNVYRKLKQKDDFDILLSDVIYTQKVKNKEGTECFRVTYGDEHETIPKTIVLNSGAFAKDYAWSYEKECRIIVKLKDAAEQDAFNLKDPIIRIRLSDENCRRLKKRIYRSPVYKGGVDAGEPSQLTGKVNWSLRW